MVNQTRYLATFVLDNISILKFSFLYNHLNCLLSLPLKDPFISLQECGASSTGSAMLHHYDSTVEWTKPNTGRNVGEGETRGVQLVAIFKHAARWYSIPHTGSLAKTEIYGWSSWSKRAKAFKVSLTAYTVKHSKEWHHYLAVPYTQLSSSVFQPLKERPHLLLYSN